VSWNRPPCTATLPALTSSRTSQLTCGSSPAGEKPHPGAQLSPFQTIDAWRYQLPATNTPTNNAPFLQTRHRTHARVEDAIRTGKDTGLGH
jgi:hypothetical protein